MRSHTHPSFGISFSPSHDYCCSLELVHGFPVLFVQILLRFDVDDLYPSLSDVLVSMFTAYLSRLSTTSTSLWIGSHSVDYALVSPFPSSFLTNGPCYLHTILIMNVRTLRFSPHFPFASHHVYLEVINANVCITLHTFPSSPLCAFELLILLPIIECIRFYNAFQKCNSDAEVILTGVSRFNGMFRDKTPDLRKYCTGILVFKRSPLNRYFGFAPDLKKRWGLIHCVSAYSVGVWRTAILLGFRWGYICHNRRA